MSSTVTIQRDRNSVVSQASCKMDVTQLEQYAYSGLWMLWGEYFEDL
jgi:hypothetical protein